ncbi:hypothetical protein [Billgrantia antri]|uniref:Uncharacterized protein n=1 Tax=Billgrantia antri TaxID=2846777 RepID=A0ABS6ZQC3_9GAMM|nr:hypothetical protein [Halomonas antri]MBW6392003.1 hypothetical protein [Halomonas antri]
MSVASSFLLKKDAKLILEILRSLKVRDNWRELPETDILIVGHQNHYNYVEEGRWYSPLLGSIAFFEEEKKKCCEIVLIPFCSISPRQAWRKHYTFNRIFSLLRFLGLISRFKFVSKKYVDEKKKNMWKRIIERSAPDKIIAIQPDKFLCLAARECGVKIVDFQHGVINDLHPWYGEKFRKDTSAKDLPEEFMVWDHDSKATIMKWANKKGASVLVVGHPWVERFQNVRENDSIVRRAIKKIPSPLSAKPKILISLQWGLEKYLPEEDYDGVMHRVFKDLLKKYSNQYYFYLRLHPVQLHGFYNIKILRELNLMKSQLGAEAFEWEQASFCALPALLTAVDVHLTFSSTVVQEAALFGVRSCIIDQHIKEGGLREDYFLSQKKNGMADVIEADEDRIASWINLELSKK